jgi:hypothetical protein
MPDERVSAKSEDFLTLLLQAFERSRPGRHHCSMFHLGVKKPAAPTAVLKFDSEAPRPRNTCCKLYVRCVT